VTAQFHEFKTIVKRSVLVMTRTVQVPCSLIKVYLFCREKYLMFLTFWYVDQLNLNSNRHHQYAMNAATKPWC
jgi:hypothetical protein